MTPCLKSKQPALLWLGMHVPLQGQHALVPGKLQLHFNVKLGSGQWRASSVVPSCAYMYYIYIYRYTYSLYLYVYVTHMIHMIYIYIYVHTNQLGLQRCISIYVNVIIHLLR